VELEGKGKRYFDWVELGIHFLPKGKHLLRLDLPALAGVDSLALTAKVAGEKASLALFGWPQQSAQVVPVDDLERLVHDLAARYRTTQQH
jgi:hypothetical protein